ncbi:hypothetical protein Tco_0262121 [Tanacetum coccineum]
MIVIIDEDDDDDEALQLIKPGMKFKPIPESERPATPEPEWTIPSNDFPEPEHNWANAYASMFKVLEENKLQSKYVNIGSFIKMFCRQIGEKKKLCKVDLEGPAFNLVNPYQQEQFAFINIKMDECHRAAVSPNSIIYIILLANHNDKKIPEEIFPGRMSQLGCN